MSARRISTDTGTGPVSGELRLRATWGQIPMQIFPIVMWGLSAWEVRLPDQRPSLWFDIGYGLSGVLVATNLWGIRRFGVTLTDDAAIVHGLRRRRIPWHQVSLVQVEAFSGNQRAVVLYDTDGRSVRLRYPSDGFLSWDRHFDERAAAVRDRWLTATRVTMEDLPGMDAGVPLDPPGPLRIDPSIVQSRLPATALIWAGSALAFEASISGAGHLTPTGWTVRVAVLVLLILAAVWLIRRVGVVLTSEHLSIQGIASRPRTIVWSAVASVNVVARPGGRRRVVLYERDGTATPLPAPRIGMLLWDPQFEERVGTLNRWWRSHRGEEWAPPDTLDGERTAVDSLSAYAGPGLWRRVLYGFAWTVLGYLITVSLVALLIVASL